MEAVRTVLVIEDNVDHAELISRTVRKLGFRDKVVATATEGFLRFRRGKVDAVVLDYSLPDEDGLSLLPRLRQRDAFIPIIMLTAHHNHAIAEQARVLGINDFIVKTAENSYLHLLEQSLARTMGYGRLLLASQLTP